MDEQTPLEQLALAITLASPTLRDAMISADQDPEADGEIPLIWAIGTGRVLAAALPVMPEDEAGAVFGLIEDAVGDPRTHDVVTIGLIETLVSRPPADLARHLGPAPAAYVRELPVTPPG